MTITLSPRTEELLRQRAQSDTESDEAPEAYEELADRLLAELLESDSVRQNRLTQRPAAPAAATSGVYDRIPLAEPMPWEEFLAAMSIGQDTPGRQPLSDYAISRDAIYEDHP